VATIGASLWQVDAPTLGRSLPDAAQEPSPATVLAPSRRPPRTRRRRPIRRRQDSARCAENRSRDSGTGGRASAFEDVHSVTEAPASILAAVTALAAASSIHPDDCVALTKAHALRRSGCHPGVRAYPWMGCDFSADRNPPS